jgi:hypothetical protein
MKVSRRTLVEAALGIPAAAVVGKMGYDRLTRGRRPRARVVHTVVDGRRVIESNAIPTHVTGDFPNPHDPSPLRPQNLRFETPAAPSAAETPVALGMWLFGVAVNGVPFDPSGPFWKADGRSGWQFEVLHPAAAVALGIDVNRAHTQGRGLYHYHGVPTGLLWSLRAQAEGHAQVLLGYAADGFPVYGPDGPSRADDPSSPPRRLLSSYRLRRGRRPGGPGGRFDGAFVEDFEYAPGLGDLDECNGRTGPTPEHPEGTYYYVLTEDFPFIPRLLRGTPDPSFRHGPPPGVSPPLPADLARYRPA